MSRQPPSSRVRASPKSATPARLDGIIAEVIAENAKAVEDYKAGKTASLQFLVGQVMKRTKGRAKPDAVTPLLVAKLDQQ